MINLFVGEPTLYHHLPPTDIDQSIAYRLKFVGDEFLEEEERIALVESLVRTQLFDLLGNGISQQWHCALETTAIFDHSIVKNRLSINSSP